MENTQNKPDGSFTERHELEVGAAKTQGPASAPLVNTQQIPRKRRGRHGRKRLAGW